MASSSLLSSIEGFSKNKLKKTVTVDKSGPLIPQAPKTEAVQNNGQESSAGGGGSVSYAQPPSMMTGGLFAGGVPTLRKTGRPGAATMLGNAQAPIPTQPAPSQPPPPLAKPANLENELKSQNAPPPIPSQPAPAQVPIIPAQPAPSQPPPPLAKPANLENEIKSQYAPPIPTQPAPAQVPIQVQAAPPPARAVPPPVQAPSFTQPSYSQSNYNSSSQADQSRKESILPTISFKIPSADEIDIEAHPAIPTFQNPLLNTIISSSKQNIQRTSKQEKPVAKIEEELIPEVESFDSVASIVPEPQQQAPLDPVLEKKKAKELKKSEFLQKIRQGDTDGAVDILQSEVTQAKRKKFLNTLVFDEQSKIKTTALHVSIESGNPALMATLLAQGADTLLPDGAGNMAIHIVCRTEYHSTLEMFRYLMGSAVDVNHQNQSGNTPLHIACLLNDYKQKINPEIVYTLLSNPFIDPLITNSSGFTSLMTAVQSGDIGIVKLFLSYLEPPVAVKLLNISGNYLQNGQPSKGNAVSISPDRKKVGEICKLLIEYGGEVSVNNNLQSSLEPFILKLAVPPIFYPSNRLCRIIGSLVPSNFVSDADAQDCLQCSLRFSVVKRRHHCRNCGMVFCSKCSDAQMEVPAIKQKKVFRVCGTCAIILNRQSVHQYFFSRGFIQREAIIYKSEIEKSYIPAVDEFTSKFEGLTDFRNCLEGLLPEPSWTSKYNSDQMKLFSIKVPLISQFQLPSELTIFQFAGMFERLKQIILYSLEINDRLEQDEISFSDSSKGDSTNSVTISEQKSAMLIAGIVGSVCLHVLTRCYDLIPSMFTFFDLSYQQMRVIIRYLSELSPSADKNPELNISFSVLGEAESQHANHLSNIAVDNAGETFYEVPSPAPAAVTFIPPTPTFAPPPPPPQQEPAAPAAPAAVEEPKKPFSLFGFKQPSNTNIVPPPPSQPPPPAPEEDIPEEEPFPAPAEEPKKGFSLFGKKSDPPPAEEPSAPAAEESKGLFSFFGKKSTTSAETPTAQEEPSAPAAPAPVVEEKKGFSLFGKKSTTTVPAAPPPPSTEEPQEEPAPAPVEEKKGFSLFGKKSTSTVAAPAEPAPEPEVEEPPKVEEQPKGLFSLFGKKQASSANITKSQESATEPTAPETPPVTEEPKKGFSLFGKKSTAATPAPEPPAQEEPAPAPVVEEKKGFSLFGKKSTTNITAEKETPAQEEPAPVEEKKGFSLFGKKSSTTTPTPPPPEAPAQEEHAPAPAVEEKKGFSLFGKKQAATTAAAVPPVTAAQSPQPAKKGLFSFFSKKDSESNLQDQSKQENQKEVPDHAFIEPTVSVETKPIPDSDADEVIEHEDFPAGKPAEQPKAAPEAPAAAPKVDFASELNKVLSVKKPVEQPNRAALLSTQSNEDISIDVDDWGSLKEKLDKENQEAPPAPELFDSKVPPVPPSPKKPAQKATTVAPATLFTTPPEIENNLFSGDNEDDDLFLAPPKPAEPAPKPSEPAPKPTGPPQPPPKDSSAFLFDEPAEAAPKPSGPPQPPPKDTSAFLFDEPAEATPEAAPKPSGPPQPPPKDTSAFLFDEPAPKPAEAAPKPSGPPQPPPKDASAFLFEDEPAPKPAEPKILRSDPVAPLVPTKSAASLFDEDPLFGSKAAKPKPETAAKSSNIFGDEDPLFGSAKPAAKQPVAPTPVAPLVEKPATPPAEAPAAAKPTKSSFFDDDEDESGPLFGGSKTSKPAIAKTNSSLFDSPASLFSPAAATEQEDSGALFGSAAPKAAAKQPAAKKADDLFALDDDSSLFAGASTKKSTPAAKKPNLFDEDLFNF